MPSLSLQRAHRRHSSRASHPPPPSLRTFPLLLALPLFLLTRLLSPVLLPFSFLRSHSSPHPRLLLFDGVCNVCNAFINLLLDYDHAQSFYFLPLSSPLSQQLLVKFNLPPTLDSMVLIDHADELIRHIQTSPSPLTTPWPVASQASAVVYSTAFITAVASLGFPWSLLSLALLLPKALRDGGYKAFASVRYRLFGTGESCRLMTKEVRKRFLEYSEGGKEEKRKVK